MKVAVNGGPASGYGLTPSTPGCSLVQAALTCVFSIPAAPGKDSFTLSLVDGAGNVLSHNIVGATLTAGAVTPVNVTLAAVPASVAIVPGFGATIDGTAASGYHLPGLFAQPIELEALDADGNVIIGPGAPTIATPAVTGSSNVTLASANTSDPNEYLLQASAGAAGQTVSVRATAQGIPLSDETTSPPITSSQNFTYTPAIVAVGGKLLSAYSVESGNLVAQWPSCGGACGTHFTTSALSDSLGNLYVTVEFIAGFSQTREVQVYPAGSTALSATLNSTNGVTGAVSVAIDNNKMLYVLNAGTGFGFGHHPPSIVEFAPGATSPTYSITGAGTNIGNPVSIAVDANHNVYESDSDGYINVYPPGNQTVPSQTLSDPSLAAPGFMALDAAGGIYVQDSANADIAYFAPGSTSVTTTISDPSFLGNPQDFIFDPSGNLWLAVNNSSVEELSGSALPASVSILETITGASGGLAWIP